MVASQNRYRNTTLYNVCEEERQDVPKLMEKKSHLNMGSPRFYKLIAHKIIFQYLITLFYKNLQNFKWKVSLRKPLINIYYDILICIY